GFFRWPGFFIWRCSGRPAPRRYAACLAVTLLRRAASASLRSLILAAIRASTSSSIHAFRPFLPSPILIDGGKTPAASRRLMCCNMRAYVCHNRLHGQEKMFEHAPVCRRVVRQQILLLTGWSLVRIRPGEPTPVLSDPEKWVTERS